MAETIEQKTVLNIDTSGSVKSVKDLKQQIKDLKDRIVELTASGENASEEYAQLGTTMRQLKDINEEAMRSSKDLGDQLAVVSGSVKGVAGAISTVTGVMGLMGVESEKGTKLLKTMASAMSITTGIQAMEAGYKSVKKLVGGFLTAARGAKTLGGAIKAAFMSNPIGLLLTAVTAAISLFSTLSDKAKEAAENIAATAESLASALTARIEGVFSGVSEAYGRFIAKTEDTGSQMFIELYRQWKNVSQIGAKYAREGSDEVVDYISGALQRIYTNNKDLGEALDDAEFAWSQYGATVQTAKEQDKEYSEAVIEDMRKATEASQRLIIVQIALKRHQVAVWEDAVTAMDESSEKASELVDKLTEAKRELNSLYVQYNTVTDNYESAKRTAEQKRKEEEDKRKRAAADALRKAQENAKKLLEVEKKAIEDRYKLLQEQTTRTLEINKERFTKMLREGQISQEEYNAKMLQFETEYYQASEKQLMRYMEQMQALKDKFATNKYLTQEEKDAIYTQLDATQYLRQLDEFRRNIADAQYEYQQNNYAADAAKQELENTIAIQEQINQIERESFEKRLALEEEYIENKNKLHYTQYELELQLLGEEREHENALYEAFVQENAQKMALLNEQYENRLIDEQTFNESMNELNQEMVERELEHEKKMVDIKRNEVDQKKQLQEMYVKFEQSMMSSVSSIFTGLADLLGDSNEDYKGLRIAATILDTLQGSIAAYTGMVSSIPGPLGIAAGIAAATGVITSGMATISKMNEVDAKNGTTTTSALATQTFTTPQTATIATGMSNDYSDMMGNAVQEGTQNQRVYVVLNDINEANSRRTEVVNSNTY